VPTALAPAVPDGIATLPSVEPRQLGLIGRIVLGLFVVAGAAVAIPSVSGLYWFVPYAGVGALLAVRRPRTPIGWLLLGVAFVSLPLFLGGVAETPASFSNGSLPLGTRAYVLIHAAGGVLTFTAFSVLAMIFPTGRFPSGGWGRIGRAAVLVEVISTALAAISPTIDVPLVGYQATVNLPNPFAVLPDLALWQVLNPSTLFLPVFPILAGAVVSLVVRFRRATGIERQQLRWIGASLALLVTAIGAGFAISAVVPGSADSGLAWMPALVVFPTIPVAVGIAVLRYRLYEIDTIINRAIVYGLLTAIVAGASAAGIALTQRLFSGLLGAASDLSIVFITLAAVAALNPIKTRLQAIVDRRFKEVRDPAKELASFLAEVHGSLSRPDRDRTLQRFLEAAVLAFGASAGEIRLRAGERQRSFRTAGLMDAGIRRIGGDPETAPVPLGASAVAGNLHAEVSLSGGDWSRGADALEPAFAGVLGELATTSGQGNVAESLAPVPRSR